MNELQKLKNLLIASDGECTVNDVVLQFLLDSAKDIICEIRHTNDVEPQYKNVQIRIACELYSKMGAEGETGHTENGISRSYEVGDVSQSLLAKITPRIYSPFSKKSDIGGC